MNIAGEALKSVRSALVTGGRRLPSSSSAAAVFAIPTVTARARPHLRARGFGQGYHHHRMSSSNSKRKEWMALIPDHANALDKRLAVRAEHLSRLQPFIDDQTVLLGGCTFADQHPQGDQTGNMNGSFIIIQAETEAEAREWIKNDLYTKSGVWNTDAVQIWPFKSAIRTQKQEMARTETEFRRDFFLDLPPEIRASVYALVFRGGSLRVWSNDRPIEHNYAHHILCTCKTIYAEGRPVLYRSMHVELVGHYILGLDVLDGMPGEKYFANRAAAILRRIPRPILRTVATVEFHPMFLRNVKFLEAFKGLRVIHLRDFSNIYRPIEGGIICAPMGAWSELKMKRLTAGALDHAIVECQIKEFRESWRDLPCAPLFDDRSSLGMAEVQLRVTTRGYLKCPKADHSWREGKIIFDREVVFDFDSQKVVRGTNVLAT